MNFAFYTVETAYCDYLRQDDPCVPYTMDKKSIRPFIGIVFSVNEYHYYAPLTSPKPKHLHMKNQIDFLKIKGGEWGAINLNNMIPVQPGCLKKVEIQVMESDSKADIDYKNLLSNQLSWCNSHKDVILKQAEKLYQIIVEGKAWDNLKSRCCNFSLDEQLCSRYGTDACAETRT
jgi:protein AbiQ